MKMVIQIKRRWDLRGAGQTNEHQLLFNTGCSDVIFMAVQMEIKVGKVTNKIEALNGTWLQREKPSQSESKEQCLRHVAPATLAKFHRRIVVREGTDLECGKRILRCRFLF